MIRDNYDLDHTSHWVIYPISEECNNALHLHSAQEYHKLMLYITRMRFKVIFKALYYFFKIFYQDIMEL